MAYRIFQDLRPSSRDENHLTRSFVFLLKYLLGEERTTCVRILNWLCAFDNDIRFNESEAIIIQEQQSTLGNKKRPDMCISSDNKLIYIEVKLDSQFSSEDQIENYINQCQESAVRWGKQLRRVILLTPKGMVLGDQEEPDKHIFWNDVYDIIASIQHDIQNPVTNYIVRSFLQYLQALQLKDVPEVFIEIPKQVPEAITQAFGEAITLEWINQFPFQGYYFEARK